MIMTVKLSKWGNSQGIRIPQTILKDIGVEDIKNTKLSLDVRDNQIILEKEKRKIEDYFKGYENEEYPFEIADKGGAIGKELF